MALGRGVRVQTADPSDSLWAAIVSGGTGRGGCYCETRWNGRARQGRAGTVRRETQCGERARVSKSF
jgi:hypothetical protein